MDVRRDVIVRLAAAAIPYYVTGSEAMAVLGIAYRATNDVDIVLGIAPSEYELRVRPAFEPDYLVNDLVRIAPRWLGSAVSTIGIGKADFIVRDAGEWPSKAMERSVTIDDPGLGQAFVSTPEDLVLAKLEWADGTLDGLQGRDIVRIIRTVENLDWRYLRANAARLGVAGLLAEARERA